MIESGGVERPDGIGRYLSEGAEVTVWENSIDSDYVIKVQKRNLLDFPPQAVPFVSQARWVRKNVLYSALKHGQRVIRVAETFFYEGFLWQERLDMTLARLMARHPGTWDRIGGGFFCRLPVLDEIARMRMSEALDGTPPEISRTFGDGLAEMRCVDAHFFNFGVRWPESTCERDLSIDNVYLIDW